MLGGVSVDYLLDVRPVKCKSNSFFQISEPSKIVEDEAIGITQKLDICDRNDVQNLLIQYMSHQKHIKHMKNSYLGEGKN